MNDRNKLKGIYNFLSPFDGGVEKADLIIGFGHFDLRIVEQCAKLYHNKMAPLIIFSGGVGGGSGNFTQPEAIEFQKYLQINYPNIPLSKVLIEPNSTNTGENIQFSISVLKNKGLFDSVGSVILVATPIRQMRVFLTAQLYFVDIKLYNTPPISSFEQDEEVYLKKHIDFKKHILGELQRIKNYPSKGFCVSTVVPDFS